MNSYFLSLKLISGNTGDYEMRIFPIEFLPLDGA